MVPTLVNARSRLPKTSLNFTSSNMPAPKIGSLLRKLNFICTSYLWVESSRAEVCEAVSRWGRAQRKASVQHFMVMGLDLILSTLAFLPQTSKSSSQSGLHPHRHWILQKAIILAESKNVSDCRLHLALARKEIKVDANMVKEIKLKI